MEREVVERWRRGPLREVGGGRVEVVRGKVRKGVEKGGGLMGLMGVIGVGGLGVKGVGLKGEGQTMAEGRGLGRASGRGAAASKLWIRHLAALRVPH